LELDENLNKYYKIFEAAPTENRAMNPKKAMADYFL
jgi:serine/threonine-protein phosphatase 4 catalytic subunit